MELYLYIFVTHTTAWSSCEYKTAGVWGKLEYYQKCLRGVAGLYLIVCRQFQTMKTLRQETQMCCQKSIWGLFSILIDFQEYHFLETKPFLFYHAKICIFFQIINSRKKLLLV